MKTNITTRRLTALILAGSIAVLTASAADSNTSTEKPAANTAPMTAKSMTEDSAVAHHRKHHRIAGNPSIASKSTPLARHRRIWFGAIAKNSHAPAGFIHRSAPDVRLTRVLRGSPADRAGLRAGDVVWKFDGARLKSTAQLHRELRGGRPGEIVGVEIFHHGKREEMKVKLAAERTAHHLPKGAHVLILG